MKNVYRVIIYRIIQNFKRVTRAVKTNNRIFLSQPINRCIVYSVIISVQNILFTNIMIKCRFVELNNDVIHNKIILLIRKINNCRENVKSACHPNPIAYPLAVVRYIWGAFITDHNALYALEDVCLNPQNRKKSLSR